MATLGFEEVLIGILDENEKVTQIHTINAQQGGAIEAKISGLQPATNTLYASNVPFYVSAVGVSNPKLELDTADLSEEVVASIAGAEFENGIIKLGANTVAPYCGVILKTKGLNNDDIYIALTKGKFGHPDGFDLKTGEDKGQEPETTGDSLAGEFVARHSDSIVYAKGRSSLQGFDLESFKEFVFPGYSLLPPDKGGPTGTQES